MINFEKIKNGQPDEENFEMLQKSNNSNLKEGDLKSFLSNEGFDMDEILFLSQFGNNEIDKISLMEKIKLLKSISVDNKQIVEIFEEDAIIPTVETNLIVKNIESLKAIVDISDLKYALDVSPELLTVREGYITENINLLKLLISDLKILKLIIMDRGEILTYKPKYLSDKLSFLIENGLKDKIVDIILNDVEIFDFENDEINLEQLKSI